VNAFESNRAQASGAESPLAREREGRRSTGNATGWLEMAAVVVRWGIGLLFIYMGLNKALDPVGFLKLVRQYDLVDSAWLLNSVAATLPWFEVFCGALLVAGIGIRGTALVLILMLAPFTGIVIERAMDIQGALGIAFCAVKFDCGCGTGEVLICRKIIENTLLFLGCVWLMTGRGQRWSVRPEIW
jgi:uncharacterized membrane protein YphA (DoxX/SURF4 family)